MTTTSSKQTILVAGGGGFIGGHLVAELLRQGHAVRAVDIKPFDRWYQIFDEAESVVADLSLLENCHNACRGVSQIYNLAADMGGMGFIELNKAACMLSVLINTHLLVAARDHKVERFFFASSACVYNADKQKDTQVTALREEDAYPAMPEDGYGWEKLFSERMCRHFREDYGLATRVARFHNVYGPHGTWRGGREKAPAAICRKVLEAMAAETPEIEIWGDGTQTRSFMFIDDCIEGILRIMHSDVEEPLNLGSAELVSINELVDLVEDIADVDLFRRYRLDAPQGVRGRNSDNRRIQQYFGWEPSTPLRVGMQQTFAWIREQFEATNQGRPGPDGGEPAPAAQPSTAQPAEAQLAASGTSAQEGPSAKNGRAAQDGRERAPGGERAVPLSRGSAEPLLTVGMPIYNAEAYLREALDSLLAQTFTDFEILISDNGSNDASEEICREYCRRDKRIHYRRHEKNQGAAWNFNYAFRAARGKYFKWAAADDRCHPQFLARCIEVLEQDPHVVACHTSTQKIDADGRPLTQLPDPTTVARRQTSNPIGAGATSAQAAKRFLDVLLTSGWSVRCYGVMRREALERTTLIQPCYGWEKVTMAELVLQGRCELVPEVLFSQRIHAGASSNLNTAQEQQSFIAPQAKQLGRATRFRLLQGFTAAIFRHELTAREQAACLLAILRYLTQLHKWPQVLQGLVRRQGIGNAGAELAASTASQPSGSSAASSSYSTAGSKVLA